MFQIDAGQLLARFLRYVCFDTQSNPSSSSYPSTESQRQFIEKLANEVRALGLAPRIDEFGYLTIFLPGVGALRDAERVVFIAHVDTSPDASGKNVNPRVVRYDGTPIALGHSGLTLDEARFPELGNYLGQEIVVTDGTTLLGADDKAGVAALMESLAILSLENKIPRRPTRFLFTMDEEIGAGVDHLDVASLDADFGYTVDGGAVGQLEFENFNAAGAVVRIEGLSIHPGEAKGRMINALRLAAELDGMLPKAKRPESTEGYEGFFHLHSLEGGVSEVRMEYLIREHDRTKFERMKATLQGKAQKLQSKYIGSRVDMAINDSYYNMRERVAPESLPVQLAKRAMCAAGIEPIVSPIRGGTDGARLSFMGLPCPNLFAGGHNFHGVYEYLPVPSLVKACEVVMRIATQE